MYVKIMSGENIPDDDPRKGYRLIEGVNEIEFGRTDVGSLLVEMLFFDGCRLVTYPEGNVYLLDPDGVEFQSMAVAPYHPDEEILVASEPEEVLGAIFFATNFRESDGFAQKAKYVAEFEGEMRYVRETVDMMGVLLAEHGHTWTNDQRAAYERTIRVLNGQIGDVPVVKPDGH